MWPSLRDFTPFQQEDLVQKPPKESAVIMYGSRASRTHVTSAWLPLLMPHLSHFHRPLLVTSCLIPTDGLKLSSGLSPQDLLIPGTTSQTPPTPPPRVHCTNLCSPGPIKLTVGFTGSGSQRLQGDHRIANTWLWDFES